MTTVSNQRVGPLASIPEILATFGVSLEKPAAEAGISPSALDDANNIVSYEASGKLLEACARACNCPHFGLLVGARNDNRALGLIGYLMANAPTLGEALFDFVSNQHRNSRGAAVYLMRGLDSYFFGYAIYNRQTEGSRHIYDLCAAIGVNTVRSLAGVKAESLEVLICHQAPEDLRPYRSILGPNVRFNQAQSAVVLSPGQLALPIPNADPVEHKRLTARVRQLLAIGSLDLVSQVRHVLKPNILLGRASREAIAEQIDMHVRMLHRRLNERSTSFRELEQEERFFVARELLEITDLEISDISTSLQYSSPSAFDRAFKRWAGTTPTDWRTLSRTGCNGSLAAPALQA